MEQEDLIDALAKAEAEMAQLRQAQAEVQTRPVALANQSCARRGALRHPDKRGGDLATKGNR